MSNVLFTFLGRPRTAEAGGYSRAVYRFPDGTQSPPLAFLGWSLVERSHPSRVVILGTAGSAWDHLVEGDLSFASDTKELARYALIEAVGAHAVTPSHLVPFEPLLSERLGCEVRLALIPYCREPAEQTRLLEIIADHVAQGDAVDLDITHGYRHLPMLTLLAALYLRRVREARLGHIWYGAYDPDSGEAPVHDLAGLLRIAEWLDALAVFERGGDYGVFAALLGESGKPLGQAAFFERTGNSTQARQQLATWAKLDADNPSQDPAAALFRPTLHERLNWRRSMARDRWEAELARHYLRAGDPLRAAIFAQEAAITNEVLASKKLPDDFAARETASKVLENSEREAADFKRLRQLRNAMAHGVKPTNKAIKDALSSPQGLAAELEGLIDALHERPPHKDGP